MGPTPTTTGTPQNDRMGQLQRMLEKSPNDPFLLYGIAMELRKVKNYPAAVEFFDRTIAADPGYCYAYYHRGQVREEAGDEEAARQSYRDGIAAAIRKGDAHARGELEAALELLGG